MKYKLVVEEDNEVLEAEVNDLLIQGWVPVGGVSVCKWERFNSAEGYAETESRWAQAMIHTE